MTEPSSTLPGNAPCPFSHGPCQCCGETADLKCGPSRFGAETWACAECWEPSITAPPRESLDKSGDTLEQIKAVCDDNIHLGQPAQRMALDFIRQLCAVPRPHPHAPDGES